MKFKYSLVVEYQNKNMYKMLLMIFSLCIIIGYTGLDTFILASVSSIKFQGHRGKMKRSMEVVMQSLTDLTLTVGKKASIMVLHSPEMRQLFPQTYILESQKAFCA